ncbi:MAG: asparagine synthase (glutamine-hydrolyzing), partial [Burkholderiales bacterium 12-64-5]
MCGIAGVIGRGGGEAAEQLKSRLGHRGPDGSGTLVTERATLVQTRLALVDPRRHPLPLTDGRFTLLFNGEIYNHRELRRELAAYPFATETDTEVAFAALLHWGVGALSRFEGMFALFLWDEATGEYLAAVDPLGVKPFVYHEGPGWFAFCSEAGPLLEAGVVPFRPCEEGVAEHLTAPYFALSPFANLQRLPGGHYLTARGLTAYRCATRNEDLLGALRRSVRTSTPAGLFLSGGVDSSLLAALAEPGMPSFTIDYGAMDYADSLIVKSDDVPFAKQVAEATGHPLTLVSPRHYEAALEWTLQSNDQIAAWEQEVSQYLLAEAARRQRCKAVLVGDAADETHYGYGFLLDPARIVSPRPLIDFFGHLPLRNMDAAAHFTEKYKAEAEAAGHSWATPGGQLRAVSYLIRQRWLARLLHNGDIQLMAHSVEGRVPFADPTVLALADAAAPEEALGKRLLRTAAAEVLPEAIAWRPKSALTKNLAGRETVHRMFRAAGAERGELLAPYVDPDFVEAMGPPRDDRETGL